MQLRTLAIAIAVCSSLAIACNSSSSTRTPTAPPSPTDVPPLTATPNAKLTVVAGLTPARAADLIARTVTRSRPLLFPNAVPNDWTAEVSNMIAASTFTVKLTSPDGTKTIMLALAAANPREPEAATVQTTPGFHGDARSLYQVQDKNDPVSFRWLLWHEPGVFGDDPKSTTAPYYLDATGLTNAEFWQIANSLHPIQR